MKDKALLVEAVMHPFPHSIGKDQSLQVAKDMMREHNIRHLPVQSGGQLVGIITERDVNFALAYDKKEAIQVSVEDVYVQEPYVVKRTTPVERVARRMAHDHLGCALVTDEQDKLLGIFTTVDACRTLAETLSGRCEQ